MEWMNTSGRVRWEQLPLLHCGGVGLGDPVPPRPPAASLISGSSKSLTPYLGIGPQPQARGRQGFIFSSISPALETGDPNSSLGGGSHPN